MSYDVYIAGESFNYTFNVSKLFYDHIPDSGKGGGIRELEGLTGRQCALRLCDAIDRIDKTVLANWENGVVGEPRFCAAYDSPNGWGSAIGGILFLSRILSACVKNPRAKVRVCL